MVSLAGLLSHSDVWLKKTLCVHEDVFQITKKRLFESVDRVKQIVFPSVKPLPYS